MKHFIKINHESEMNNVFIGDPLLFMLLYQCAIRARRINGVSIDGLSQKEFFFSEIECTKFGLKLSQHNQIARRIEKLISLGFIEKIRKEKKSQIRKQNNTVYALLDNDFIMPKYQDGETNQETEFSEENGETNGVKTGKPTGKQTGKQNDVFYPLSDNVPEILKNNNGETNGETSGEQTGKPTGTKEDKEKIREEDKKNNIISKEITEFGNSDITKILEFLKKSVGVSDFKESKQYQRNFGKHLHSLLGKFGKEEFVKRLNSILSDSFKSKNCNSIRYLYGDLKSVIHSPIIRKSGNLAVADLE